MDRNEVLARAKKREEKVLCCRSPWTSPGPVAAELCVDGQIEWMHVRQTWLSCPARMTLVRLAVGCVFVHSPIARSRCSEADGAGELCRLFRGLG